MPDEAPDRRDLGHYYALAQVGMEFVVPIGAGVWLDWRFGWAPWGAVIGAVLGFVVGLVHLVVLVNQHAREQQPPRAGDRP